MSDVIRVGVVGAGWFASRRHLPDLVDCPGAEIAALCRRNEAELNKIADHFEVAGRYTDYGVMLQEAELDSVLVATPHSLHYEQTQMALERDLHVLLEKPMTIHAGEAQALADLAAERNLVLSVALNPPFWGHCHFIRDLIQSGEIGDLEAISYHWISNAEGVFGRATLPDDLPGVVRPTLYRQDAELNGGGNFVDSGSHLLSELLWVTGRSALSVSAQMDDPVMDMRASLQIALSDNLPAQIVATGDSTYPDRRIENVYFGSKATLRAETRAFWMTIEKHGESSIVVPDDQVPDVLGPVAHLIDVIQNGAEAVSPPEHGVDVVRVMESAYQSAKDGRRIDLV